MPMSSRIADKSWVPRPPKALIMFFDAGVTFTAQSLPTASCTYHRFVWRARQHLVWWNRKTVFTASINADAYRRMYPTKHLAQDLLSASAIASISRWHRASGFSTSTYLSFCNASMAWGICATCAILPHPIMPTRRTGDSGDVAVIT